MIVKGNICIVTDRHLCTNPRVWKEADVLARNGYDVTIITSFNSRVHKGKDENILKQIDSRIKYVAAIDLSRDASLIKQLFYKGRMKLALMLKRLGFDSVYILTFAPGIVYKKALSVKADLYIAHVEGGMIAGLKLLKKGKIVAFDIEDWYSEDYLNQYRPVKLLQNMEEQAIRSGVYITCPSLAMAHALDNAYGVCSKTHAIYNSFPADQIERIENDRENEVRILWFSQVVGPGRGLEQFISVLPEVRTPVSLLLLGQCAEDYKASLEALLPKDSVHRLLFKMPVSHDQLQELIGQFDIGLALESTYPESRNKTITNKILQYLQAGIKVFATSTEGQLEVANYLPDNVTTVDAEDASRWALSLEELIRKQFDRKAVEVIFRKNLAWETQEKKILELVDHALKT